MARFIESPLNLSTITFEYLDNGTLESLTLDAMSFTGGGGGDSNHSHGNILSTGTITASAAITTGYHFLVTNTNNKIVKAQLAFGSSSDYFLANNGSWYSVQGGGTTVVDTHTRLFEMPWNATGLTIWDVTSSTSAQVTFGQVASYINNGDVVKIKVPFDMGTAAWYMFDRAYDAMGVYYFEGNRTWKNATHFQQEMVTFNAVSDGLSIPAPTPVSYMVPMNIVYDMSLDTATVDGYRCYLQKSANLGSIVNAYRTAGNNVTLRCSNCGSLFNGTSSDVFTWRVNYGYSSAGSWTFAAPELIKINPAGSWYKTYVYCLSSASTTSAVFLQFATI